MSAAEMSAGEMSMSGRSWAERGAVGPSAAGGNETGKAGAGVSGGGEQRLTHVDEAGDARMVDVGGKEITRRAARAGARVWMAPATLRLLQEQAVPKGDVFTVAKVAGIMAAKRTSELIPLCHPLALTHVDLTFSVVEKDARVDIECSTRTEDRTGIEMEALTGAAVAALTIYDMCKAVDRGMVVGDIRLLEKTGGKEDYLRLRESKPGGSALGGSAPRESGPDESAPRESGPDESTPGGSGPDESAPGGSKLGEPPGAHP